MEMESTTKAFKGRLTPEHGGGALIARWLNSSCPCLGTTRSCFVCTPTALFRPADRRVRVPAGALCCLASPPKGWHRNAACRLTEERSKRQSRAGLDCTALRCRLMQKFVFRLIHEVFSECCSNCFNVCFLLCKEVFQFRDPPIALSIRGIQAMCEPCFCRPRTQSTKARRVPIFLLFFSSSSFAFRDALQQLAEEPLQQL